MIYTITPKVNLDELIDVGVWNKEVEKYSKVKCVNNSEEFHHCFMCYNYALGNNISTCEDGMEELEFNYRRIKLEEARKGDIVSYHQDFNCKGKKQIDRYSIDHFAVIFKTDGTFKGTIIKSKWGCDGVFKGAIDEVPDIYGKIIVIWRKI